MKDRWHFQWEVFYSQQNWSTKTQKLNLNLFGNVSELSPKQFCYIIKNIYSANCQNQHKLEANSYWPELWIMMPKQIYSNKTQKKVQLSKVTQVKSFLEMVIKLAELNTEIKYWQWRKIEIKFLIHTTYWTRNKRCRWTFQTECQPLENHKPAQMCMPQGASPNQPH